MADASIAKRKGISQRSVHIEEETIALPDRTQDPGALKKARKTIERRTQAEADHVPANPNPNQRNRHNLIQIKKKLKKEN